MKTCPKCQRSEPDVVFGSNRSRQDGKQAQCKSCHNKYKGDHYLDNKKYYSDKRERIRHRNREMVFSHFSEHPCVDCGETDPIVLTFDHVRGKKEFNVSESVGRQLSIARIKEEIMKCEVRCCNCHARKTAKDFGWYASFLQPTTQDKV